MIVSVNELYYHKIRRCCFVLVFVIVITVLANSEAKIIELNHDGLGENSALWPKGNSVPFKLTPLHRGMTEYGWLEINKFSTQEHIGTHLDAPSHFQKDQWTTDKIPPEHLIAPGVVINIRNKVEKNSIYQLSSSDVKEWVEKNGMFPNNSVILVNTGWSKRYADKVAYFGHHADTTTKDLTFPGVGVEAMQAILDYRHTSGIKVVGIGIDTASLDYGPSKSFPSHRAVAAENVYILENLNNLEELPTRGAQIIAMPLKIIGGSGSPCRVLALINEDQNECGNGVTRLASNYLLLFLVPLLLLFKFFICC